MTAELDDYIEQARVAWGAIGLSVAAIRGEDIAYERGFGHKELGGGDGVDPDTLFQVGSTTKALTAAALAMLVEEGRLGWDDPVVEHLPSVLLEDPWITRHLTIRDTLTHRSGVADTLYYALGKMDADQTIRQLRHLGSSGAFRDSFVYSNLMYALAGRVLEAAAGSSWHEFLRERLLGPLSMARSETSPYEVWDGRWVAPTFFGTAPTPQARAARKANVALPHGYGADGSVAVLPWQSFDSTAAAGGLVSSARDMAKWLVLNVTAGSFGGKQLLSTQTVASLHAPQNIHSGVARLECDQDRDGYAMGWWRGRYRDHSYLEHGGNMIGFPAHVACLPSPRIGVVVLSNGPKWVRDDFTLHKAIARRVFDHLLGEAPRDWAAELLEDSQNALRLAALEHGATRQPQQPAESSSLPLERYAGTYEDSRRASGHVNVRTQEGSLQLSFRGEGAFSATLQHWQRDVFRLRGGPGVADMLDAFGPQFVLFTLGPTGQAVSMVAFGPFGGTFNRC